jgi:hypothetical protein
MTLIYNITEERAKIRKLYAQWNQMEKGDKSQISGANPTNEQKENVYKKLNCELEDIRSIKKAIQELEEIITHEVESL